MTARPEVVALLTDFGVAGTGADQRFVHRDGRPFTPEETGLLVSAADEDMRAAARELAAAPEPPRGAVHALNPQGRQGDERPPAPHEGAVNRRQGYGEAGPGRPCRRT